MARIRFDDLPPLEQLSPEELEQVVGAGRARLGLEQLESRELMAASVTANLVGTSLRVEGSPGNDQITVRTVGSVSTPSTFQTQVLSGNQMVSAFDAASIKAVEVWGLQGND